MSEELDWNALRREVKRSEGCRLRAYQDTRGIWTIGYGTNLQTLEVDLETAEEWFEDRLGEALRDARTLSPWPTLDPIRRRVLVDMVYNMGLVGVKGFVKFLAALASQQWEVAVAEMLDSKWAQQVPNRAKRNAEIILTGRVDG